MNTQEKVFAASVDSLEPMRDFVTQEGESLGLTKKKIYGLCLAIDEIATNIIRYGYPNAGIAEGEGEIKAIVNKDAQQLTVTLQDSGIAFNPLQHLVPSEEDINKPLEERPIGGLGILLAQQNVDKFDYRFAENFNQNIFMVKNQ